ncbi:zinc-binding alcohol dehydrogenase [Georgenia yuyongxinii]|uniref:Zinc-binding alcohol dehydrogenase n=1 Tax=Georgenia yuyongxinii TaxID=2589797 RepID=A0A5B8BYM9_9MICO|nr:zinc-binding alcohol dehydrogenase [Georgenia yuyongxinii]
MPEVVRFTAPRVVEVVPVPSAVLQPGQVRIRTIASGISAGTEMTAYRGTSPYLTSVWDPQLRLFQHREDPSAGYPLEGWGYSEVGEIVEMAERLTMPQPGDVAVGDLVWGIWGHRTEGVVDAVELRGHRLPAGVDPVLGCFVRVGAIALNAVLAAHSTIGFTVCVIGQGVVGLLATRYAVLTGATVIAVEQIPRRREMAVRMGAHHVLQPGPDLPRQVRELTGGAGVDSAVEISGSYAGLQAATRTVGLDGVVVAAGFYQGQDEALRLGEEFHHNRVQIVASQIGSVPSVLRSRWDVPRLQRTVVELLLRGEPDVVSMVTHRYPLARAAEAYAMLDGGGADALQVILEAS